MKTTIKLILALALLAGSAHAQIPEQVEKVSATNAITGDLVFPTGRTLTLDSGSTLTLDVTHIRAALDVIGTTRGAIFYRGESGWVLLSPGTSGYVLTSAGAGADPAWAAGASGDLTEVQEGAAIDVTSGTGPIPTVAWDATEATNLSWSAGGSASFTHTYNISTGTDPVFTFASTGVALNVPLTVTGTVAATTVTGAAGGVTLDASGFNGNLAVSDNTFQEVAQKVDDLIIGGSQNVFTTFSVSGQSSVVTDSPTDEITFAAGTGITITTNATTDTVTITNSGGATDLTAIHTDGTGEVNGLTDKASPSTSDVLMIEDAAASFAKKDITIGSLEATLEAVMDLQDFQGAVTDAQVPNTITVSLATSSAAVEVADTTDTTSYVGLFESQSGTLASKTDTGITYNAGTGMLSVTGVTSTFTGNLTGNVTGDVSGNAGTATTATSASTANAGDSATAFFSAGQIERARGGTNADTSAYGAGILGSDVSNATIDIDTIAEVETAIGGATNILVETEIDSGTELLALYDDETGTGVPVFSISPTLVTPALGTPTALVLTNATGLPQAGTVGLTTADSPQFTAVNIGAATDTTVTRTGAGDIAVEGNAIYRAGGTDIPVTDGGTGRSTGTTAYALIATGTTATGAQQTLAAGATTELLVGGGASALPVWTTATGSGAPVRGTSPTIASPTVTGAITKTNAVDLVAGSTMAALAVDVTKSLNTKSISADSTLTFSATPTAGTKFGLRITNSDTAAHTITIPSSYSEALGTRTSFVLPGSSTLTVGWQYDGSLYRIYGDPVRIVDLTTATPDSAADYVEFHDATDGLSKKALWPSAGTGTVTATGGSLTSNAFVLGAGTTDTKVVSGIATDGTSQMQLGVAGATVGSVQLRNATSGTWTLFPPSGAMGTLVITGPAASGTLAIISDTAFASSWNGVTGTSPSANAVYDIMHIGDTDDDGKINVLDLTAGLVKTDASGNVSTAVAGTDYIASIGTGAIGATELASTAVTPGSYTAANITVDADGRITAAANGSGSSSGYSESTTVLRALGWNIGGQTLGLNTSMITAGSSMSDGTVWLIPIYLKAGTYTGVSWYQSTQGVYTADNYNGVALYSYSAGTLTLQASSTNDGAIWSTPASNSWASKDWSSTYVVATDGVYWVGLHYNNSAATTAPSLGSGTALTNVAVSAPPLANSAKLFGSVAGQTSLPSSQAMSGVTAMIRAVYVAVY